MMVSKEKQREYSRKWYEQNRALQRERNDLIRKRNREWLAAYKATLTCIRCGENCAVCLEFHHTDPSKKDLDIAQTIRQGWGIERIKREIAKCIVLCANCHRKEHANFV